MAQTEIKQALLDEAKTIVAPWVHPFGSTPGEEKEIVSAIAAALAAKDAEILKLSRRIVQDDDDVSIALRDIKARHLRIARRAFHDANAAIASAIHTLGRRA